MPVESMVLAAIILVVGAAASIALFGISKALSRTSESASRTENAINELGQKLSRSSAEATRAIEVAAQKLGQAADTMGESLRKLEQRVSESINSRDIQIKEDRQIAQSIASDNRSALRESAQGLKERIEEVRDRITAIPITLKNEANESRKWDSEKASERLQREIEWQTGVMDGLGAHLVSIAGALDEAMKRVAERIDQGARLTSKATEAKGDELVNQLKSIPLLEGQIRSIASQLEQNRDTLEALRRSIVADVSSLTGE